MNEAGFEHPLLWAGWGKREVREEARRRGLPNWDQPSDACLASRVAHGDPVSAELLARIESAEKVLLDRGFLRVRVRVRSDAARIEVDPSEVPRLLEEPLASEVTAAVAQVGFRSVSVDPRGDNPETVAAFLKAHEMTGRMKFLIGSAAQLAPVWKSWNVGSTRDAGNPELVAHTALVYGVSASGKLVTIYPENFQPGQIVHDLPKLLQE